MVTGVTVKRGFSLDILRCAMQTGIMLGKVALIHALLGSALLGAQQPAAPAQDGPASGPADTRLSAQAKALTAKVLESYYHPDQLQGLDCDVTPDWPAFLASAKVAVSPTSMQAIQALRVHVQTLRDQTPEFTFNWTQGRPADASQFEASLKQMIGGFYDVYWPLFASPAIKYTAVISKIERQPDGTTKVYEADPNVYVVMTVDKHGTPMNYTIQSPAMSGIVEPHYTPTSHQVRGDRRRITSVDVSRQVGASILKVQVSLDYQPLQNYFVPEHVSYSRVGAYILTMDFSGCSVAGSK